MTGAPICKLCLFKIELIEDEIALHVNTTKLYEILQDIFKDKVKISENELQLICKSCYEKLESFHEYYTFVLENQIKYYSRHATKPLEITRETFVSTVETDDYFPEFVEVVKTEPGQHSSESKHAKEDKKAVVVMHQDQEISDNENYFDDSQMETMEFDDETEETLDVKPNIDETETEYAIETDKSYLPSNDSMKSTLTDDELSEAKEYEKSKNSVSRSYSNRSRSRGKGGRPRMIGPRNRDIRKRKKPSKLTMDQMEQKLQTYQTITEFYEMTCEQCDGRPMYATYAELIKHGRREHGKPRVWTCCNFRLASTTQLYEHAMRHKNPNECRHCGEKFTGLKLIKTHKCPNAPKYICNECGKPCPNKCAVRDHLRVVHFPDFIYCELCGRGFNKAYMHKFRQHMEYDHGNLKPEDIFKPCPTCGMLVNTRNYGMKDHIRERHEKPAREGPGPSICPQCSKQFAHHKNLQRHIREEHILGRKHRCEFCHKGFLNLKCLKEHVAIHTGLPNYICEYCEATFKSNGNFCAHKRRLHPVEYAAEKAARAKQVIFIKKDEEQQPI